MAATIAIAACQPATPAAGQDLRDHAESLNAVPADAAFYAAWLRGKEQVQAASETNAWRRFTSIPFLQMGWMQVQTQWQFPANPQVRQVKQWVEGPDGSKLISLLGEMMSEEVFVVGESSFTELLQLALDVNVIVNRAQYKAIGGQIEGGGEPDPAEIAEAILNVLKQRKDDIQAPGLVMGFRIESQDKAAELLDLAEAELRKFAELCPVPINDEISRVQSGESDLLTLTLSAKMLPWDDIADEFDGPPEVLEEVKGLLEGKEMLVTLGTVDDFVVVAVGDSLDIFDNLGDGPLLVDGKELKRLAKHASEKITSLGYVSGELMKLNADTRGMEDLMILAEAGLGAADLDESREEAIKSDLKQAIDGFVEWMPEPGAVAAVTFETARGYESFAYNWGEMASNIDGSKPLTLIDHLGSDSLGWIVGRGKQSVEGYNQTVDWLKRAFGHVQAIAEQKAEPDKWADYVEVRDRVLPLLSRLDQATKDSLIPAMADGQGAIVIDASVKDANWCDYMSPAGAELPLPTAMLVYGVSDAELLKQGAADYFAVVQDALDEAHDAEPDQVPAIELPMPDESVLSGGTVYSYPLPPVAGASPRLEPHACLGDSVLVLGFVPEVSEKLLAGGGVGIDGPAAEFDRPLASAGHFKFAKTVEMLSPWIDYGIQVAVEQAGDGAAGAVGMVGMFKPQVEQLLEVLTVFDSYTGVTYRDGDTWVTHGETRVIDLEN
ncbi:MAG: hypothetical protein AAGJ46_18180 [Planctomycetota bacterium]